jgi:hypothetical protein
MSEDAHQADDTPSRWLDLVFRGQIHDGLHALRGGLGLALLRVAVDVTRECCAHS